MARASRWIHIVCMLLLPLGQHAALAHVAEHHFAPESHAPHADAGDADDAASHVPECEFDGLYAQVLGGACTVAFQPALVPGPDRRVLEAHGARLRPDLPAQRSRGPPVLS